MKKKYTKADGNFIIINEKRPRDRAPMAWREELQEELGIEDRKYYTTLVEAQADADKVNARNEAKVVEGLKGYKFRYVVKDVSPKAPDTRRKTCQICARPILANTGTIAHHGYTVKWGFFMGSCEGSLALPYEEDRTVLGKHIGTIKSKLEGEENYLKTLNTSDPDILRTERTRENGISKDVLVEYTPDNPKYVLVKRRIVYETESNIRQLTKYLIDQTKRYDNWKAQVLV